MRRISRYFDVEALVLTAFVIPMLLVPYLAWSHGVAVVLALLVYSLIALEKRLREAEDRVRRLEDRGPEHV